MRKSTLRVQGLFHVYKMLSKRSISLTLSATLSILLAFSDTQYNVWLPVSCVDAALVRGAFVRLKVVAVVVAIVRDSSDR